MSEPLLTKQFNNQDNFDAIHFKKKTIKLWRYDKFNKIYYQVKLPRGLILRQQKAKPKGKRVFNDGQFIKEACKLDRENYLQFRKALMPGLFRD